MPRPVDRNKTIDLHAPWWSDAKDAGGRYLERWVVREEMTERDQQEIAQKVNQRLAQVTAGKNSKQLGEAMMQQIIQANLAFARLYQLLQMTEEITDESGTPLHRDRDLISSFATRDTEFVSGELDQLYGKPEIEVLPADEEKANEVRAAAERGWPVDESQATAEGAAIARFPAPRKTRV